MKRVRIYNKTYLQIGPFEFQFGHIGRGLGVWYHHRFYVIKKGRY